MVQNSFCPKCEEEQHGDKGKTNPVVPIWDQLNDLEEEDEKTQPMSKLGPQPQLQGHDFAYPNWRAFKSGRNSGKTLQAAWEKRYGRFDGWRIDGLTTTESVVTIFLYDPANYNKDALTYVLPDFEALKMRGKDFFTWQPVFAKWFPV